MTTTTNLALVKLDEEGTGLEPGNYNANLDTLDTQIAAKGTSASVTSEAASRDFGASQQGAPTAKTSTSAITAAELVTKIITTTGVTAPSIHQLPTGTLLLAAVVAIDPAFAPGDAFDFTIINTGTGGSDDATITVNTDVTIVGSPTIGAITDATIIVGAGRFRARYTTGVTWIVYRLA